MRRTESLLSASFNDSKKTEDKQAKKQILSFPLKATATKKIKLGNAIVTGGME